MSEDIIIPIAGMITAVVLVLGIPLVVVQARKLWVRDSARQQDVTPDLDHRLDRIEQAIDAMAVEVERISEGQRFMTRLLSDRQEKVAIPAGQRHHDA